MTMAVDEAELRRLRWRSRRGLLENDLMLERFLAQQAASLDGRGLAAFQRLLAYEDNDLWDVLSGRAVCSEPELQEMVNLIRAG